MAPSYSRLSKAIRVKITEIDFIGAAAFTQKQLRGVIKLKRHWMWSWLTGNGVFKQDQYGDDQDLLRDLPYRQPRLSGL